jgi:murein lipoprotein
LQEFVAVRDLVERQRAQEQRKAAEAAAEKGDSDTVMKQAKLANDQVQKGLAQLNYPMLKVGD